MIAKFPPGYGADLTSLQTRPCNIIGCSSCPDDFLKCKACDSAAVPAIYFYEGQCYQAQNTPNPYEADPLSSTALICTDVNCVSCRQNHGFCVDCRRANPETFLFEQYGTCLVKTSIPKGWGPDYSNYSLLQCTDPNCTACASLLTTSWRPTGQTTPPGLLSRAAVSDASAAGMTTRYASNV